MATKMATLFYAIVAAVVLALAFVPSLEASTDHDHGHSHEHADEVPRVPATASYWLPNVEDDMLGAFNEHTPGILDEVSELTGITFERTTDRDSAFLVIEWGQTSRENNHDGVIMGSERTIVDEVTGEYLSSLVTINTDKIAGNMYFDEFRVGSDRVHIKTLLRHEIGHSLGLGHADSTDELMTAVITDYTGGDSFSPGAAAELRELYNY